MKYKPINSINVMSIGHRIIMLYILGNQIQKGCVHGSKQKYAKYISLLNSTLICQSVTTQLSAKYQPVKFKEDG